MIATIARPAAHLVTGLALVSAAAGCESDQDKQLESAPDTPTSQFVCAADAEAVDVPAELADVPLPDGSIVYDVEDREGAGLIITAANPAAMGAVLDQLNQAYMSDGFKITEGETEEHDAEASWTNGELSGRWGIKDTANDCDGSGTQVQVFVAN